MKYCKNVHTCPPHLNPIIFEHSANHDHWNGPLINHDQAVHNEDHGKVSDSHAHPDIEQQHDVLDIRCIDIIHSQTLVYLVYITNTLAMDLIQLPTCFIVVLFIDIFDLTISELVTGHLIGHPEQSILFHRPSLVFY